MLKPAGNVILAFVGYVCAGIALHYTSKFGIDIPKDVADALPGGVAIALAHGWDVWTGDNKPKT